MSDGTLSPVEIVELAAKKGLRAIAITDHDTFAGVESAQIAGLRVGLEVLSGIELSVKHKNRNLHILGYLFDPESKHFIDALKKVQDGREERNGKIITKLKDLGLNVTLDEVTEISDCGQIGRPHIAQLLVKKNYVRSMDEAFDRYLGINGQAYISRYLFSPYEAIELIKNSGGLSVLAHPLSIYNSCENFESTIEKLKAMGLDGIEAYYPTHSKKFRLELIALATEKNMIVTGGSDYHGDIRPGTTLAGGKNVSVPYELIETMVAQVGRQ